MLDGNGDIVDTAADELFEETRITIVSLKLVYLTALTLNEDWGLRSSSNRHVS